MPSDSPQIARLGALAIAVALLAGTAAGCSTTQEKAERQQARSKHILEARDKRQQQRKNGKHDKSRQKEGKSQ